MSSARLAPLQHIRPPAESRACPCAKESRQRGGALWVCWGPALHHGMIPQVALLEGSCVGAGEVRWARGGALDCGHACPTGGPSSARTLCAPLTSHGGPRPPLPWGYVTPGSGRYDPSSRQGDRPDPLQVVPAPLPLPPTTPCAHLALNGRAPSSRRRDAPLDAAPPHRGPPPQRSFDGFGTAMHGQQP